MAKRNTHSEDILLANHSAGHPTLLANYKARVVTLSTNRKARGGTLSRNTGGEKWQVDYANWLANLTHYLIQKNSGTHLETEFWNSLIYVFRAKITRYKTIPRKD